MKDMHMCLGQSLILSSHMNTWRALLQRNEEGVSIEK